jgi:hypothetical protein
MNWCENILVQVFQIKKTEKILSESQLAIPVNKIHRTFTLC